MTPTETRLDSDERQGTVAEERPPLLSDEGLPTRMPEAVETRPEAPSVATPPTPPPGGLAASIQRMSPGWRWALGLALAFLSGVSFLFGPYTSNYGSAVFITAIALMFALALAAGFVLTNWWAALALAVAGAAGGVAGTALLLFMNPNTAGGGMPDATSIFLASGWFAILGLGPIIALLFAGVGLGKTQGLTLGQAPALSEREKQVGRWVAAIAPLIAAGWLAPNVAYIQGDAVSILTGSIYAVVLAAPCLLAGWLLRSWWGFALAPVVYAGVAAIWLQMQSGAGLAGLSGLPSGFFIYILLPAVVMSAIGTAIGMYRARRR